MQIKISGSANFSQVRTEYDKLIARQNALKESMERTAMIPQGGSAAGFAAQQRALKTANNAYAHTLAASGAYRVEQLKLNDAIDQQVQLLQKQKLSFRDVALFRKKDSQQAKRMNQVYRQQLAMQKGAMAATTLNAVTDGRNTATLAVPSQVPQSWNTLGKQIGFVGHQLSSASTQLQNWGKNTQWAGRQMMVGIGMPLAALGAAAGYQAYQVDKELTRIQKVYDTTADANSKALRDQMAVERELKELRLDALKTATESAKQYGAAVTDTLQVQAELAATGQRGTALQKNTMEVMRIARLGEIDQETATKSLIALQQTLGASTRETADAFNYMNAVENATSLATADFAAAIPRALAPMKQMSAEGATTSDVLENFSVLLVAMRERGIEAGEGANAIKAMMQRLYRPSKKIREEWQQIAGIDPSQLVERAGGDIMKILPMISDAVSDLSKPDRIKALAGLFGTYQVTRMSAMLEGINNINDASSQTNAVFKLNQQSFKEYADIADREMERYQKSLAGQYDIALQTVKVELAKMGEPFLWFAAGALKGLGQVMEMFNNMPSWAKKGAIVGAILLAIGTAGVMLLGVFANLIGTGGKFIATVMKSVGTFELMTKAQFNARVSAKLAEDQFEKEASAVTILNTQVRALTNSLGSYAAAMNQARGVSMAQQAAAGGAVPAGFNQAQSGLIIPGAAPPLDQQKRVNDLLDEEKETRAGINKYAAGAALSSAAMAASMGTMLVSGNQVVDSIAKYGMIASIAIPAVSLMADGWGQVKGSVFEAVGNARNWTKTQAAGAANAARTAYSTQLAAAQAGKHATSAARTTKAIAAGRAAMSGLATASSAAAAGIAGLMGPVGWISAIVGAIGFGVYKWWQHEKKVTLEKKAQIKAIADQKNLLGDILDIEEKSPRKLTSMLPDDAWSGMSIDAMDALEQNMRKRNKPLVNAYKGGSDEEKSYIAATKYAQVLNSVGGNSQKAKAYVEALFKAAGDGALEARTKANELFRTIGEGVDESELATTLGNGVIAAIDDSGKYVAGSGTKLGVQVADAIARGGKDSARKLLNSMSDGLDTGWTSILNKLSSSTRDTLSKIGMNSGQGLSSLSAAMQKEGSNFAQYAMEQFNLSQEEALNLALNLDTVFASNGQQIERMGQVEEEIVRELAKQLGINMDNYTIEELRQQTAFKMLSVTSENAEHMYKQAIASKTYTNEQKLALAQQIAQASGLKVMDNLEGQLIVLAQAHGDKWERAAASIDGAGSSVDNIKNKIAGIPNYLNIALNFSGQQMAQVRKAGMEGVTNEIADAATSNFENRMNSNLEGISSYWDRRIDAQQRAGENAAEKMDARWENINAAFEKRYERRNAAVERYYDKRINAVERAIKAEQKAEATRQRIFEAEERRISRAADMANRSIDFNMSLRTGDLDEAAKIKNDMEAQANTWMVEDAQRRGQSASERRLARLSGRQDALEEQRSKALKALQKREKDERDSLKRREQAEKRSLDKRTKANADALKRQGDAAKRAAQALWENERTNFDRRLTLFKSYIARDQKDLERWMKEVGLSYDDFGGKVKKKGESWSQFFKRSLASNIKRAGTEIASDNMWSRMGQRTAKQTARGMGFPTMASFKEFMKSGKLPGTFGTNLGPAASKSKTAANGDPTKPGPGRGGNTGAAIAAHTGGLIGRDNTSRKGVARTMRGLHPSETMMNVQKGEYIVPKDKVKGNEQVLDTIRSGGKIAANRSIRNTGDGIGGGAPGIAGWVAAAVGKSLMQGMSSGIQQVATKKIKSAQVASGPFTGGLAGKYGDRNFSTEQLKNAATIASVGRSMGMSKRDLQIGIMTAITESGLVNVNFGDRDSLGLFQQRPSQGWGTPEQVRNPRYAARKFFEGLKGVTNRGDMSPWMAAQTVQRSAYSNGSNYKQYWDEAVAIMSRGLTSASGTGANTYAPGRGGLHKPSVPGKGWSNSHDYRNGPRTPLYAWADGRVTVSKSTRSGGSSTYPGYPRGYTSYGETVVVSDKSGNKVRYAHLAPGTRIKTGPVKGGTVVGLSGMTGNASGYHTHFEYNGSYNAREAFQRLGIGLGTGGYTKKDGMANLHKDEVVISPDKTAKLYAGIDNLEVVMNAARSNVGNGIGGNDGAGGEYGNLLPGFADFANVIKTKYGRTQAAKAAANSANNTDSFAAGSGKPGDVRSGAYNIYQDSRHAASVGDIKRLVKISDILSLQEYRKNKSKVINPLFAKLGWGLFGQNPSGTAIAWNKSKLKLLKTGMEKLGNGRIPGMGGEEKFVPYGLFKTKSGAKFWQASVHTIAKPHRGKAQKNRRAQQFAALRNLQNRLGKSAPVIMSGDFNSGYTNMGDHKMLSKIGLAGARYSGASTMDDRRVYHDQILTRGVKRTSGYNVIGKGMASDHNALISSYRIPGLNTGGFTMSDGLAMLHKKELVLSPEKTKELYAGIERFANSEEYQYNNNIYVYGGSESAEKIATLVEKRLEKRQARRPSNRGR